MAEQCQGFSIVSFARFHIRNQFIFSARYGCRACLDVFGMEIARAGTAYNQNNGVGRIGCANGLIDVALRGIPNGASFDVTNHGSGRNGVSDAFEYGYDVFFGLGCGVIAQLIIEIIGIGPDNGNTADVF